MRIHTDRKQLDRPAIAFVVIFLLSIVALAILLSRLNAFFEAKTVRNRPLARMCDAMVNQ